MEFFVGIAGLAPIYYFLLHGLKNPAGRVNKFGKVGFLVIHALLVASIFCDWARGSQYVTPLELALDGHLMILLPGMVSMSILVAFLIYRWDSVWLAFSLSLLGFVLFIPTLIIVEDQILSSGFLLSFQAPIPLCALVLSVIAPFLVVPAVTQKIPRKGTRLWAVAFFRRRELLEGLRDLSGQNEWDYFPPNSILETGSASGRLDGHTIDIQTKPRIQPFAYQITVCVGLAHPKTVLIERLRERLSSHSWLNSKLTFSQSGSGLTASYVSASAIPFAKADLEELLNAMVLSCGQTELPAGTSESGVEPKNSP